MWTAIKSTCTCIALLAVAFLAITVARDEHTTAKHLNDALMRVGDAEDQVNIALKRINAPGGLLQVTGKTVAKADNLIGHTDILVANEQASLDKWNRQIDKTLNSVNLAVEETAENENKITQSSVETLNATTASVNALRPVEQQLATEVDALHTATLDITAMLPDIQATARNVNGISLNLNGTTDDVHRVTKKVADDYLTPVPWWKWPIKQFSNLLDIGAAVARHTP